MGASHGIGYLLGTVCGVPHGYTSCVMLPAVLKWNAQFIGALDAKVAEALGQKGRTASEAVASLVADLGLPRTLGDVGVRPDQLADIAERAARHPVVMGNVRPIKSPQDVMQILEFAS
jgi:maleylacetate reductase